MPLLTTSSNRWHTYISQPIGSVQCIHHVHYRFRPNSTCFLFLFRMTASPIRPTRDRNVVSYSLINFQSLYAIFTIEVFPDEGAHGRG